MDSHADAPLAPTHPGNHGDNGGGQPPLPTVTSVRHSCAMAVPERAAPAHSAVQEGGGAEATALGGEGGKGSNFKGIQRLWTTP